jgi:hypothetical protein
MVEDSHKQPFFLIIIDEGRGGFSVEGPMIDHGRLRFARRAADTIE